MFVIDASVALTLIIEDESSAYADRVADLLSISWVTAPVIWPLEVANGLISAVRRGRILHDDHVRLIADLNRLGIEINQDVSIRTLGQAPLSLGLAHGITAYDASYLELALRLGIPLATQDRRLGEAAAAVGVEILQP